MNKTAVKLIGTIIKKMMQTATKRNAPVFNVGTVVSNNPYKALVFTMLSSRTKDSTTINACQRLFRIAPTIEKLMETTDKTIERTIYGVGFYRTKAKRLKEMAKMLLKEYDGVVPETIEELMGLPGVGRKTANIVLATVFNKDAIGVDVHVHRISNRLGVVKTKKPEETEKQLMKIINKKYWKTLNIAMVSYGQTLCFPRNPECNKCPVKKHCMRIGV